MFIELKWYKKIKKPFGIDSNWTIYYNNICQTFSLQSSFAIREQINQNTFVYQIRSFYKIVSKIYSLVTLKVITLLKFYQNGGLPRVFAKPQMNTLYLETLTFERPFRHIIFLSVAWTSSVYFHWFTLFTALAPLAVSYPL